MTLDTAILLAIDLNRLSGITFDVVRVGDVYKLVSIHQMFVD